MQIIPGLAISGTIFIGKVRILHQRKYTSYQTRIDQSQVGAELRKLQKAIKDLESTLQKKISDPATSQLDKDILSTHLMITIDVEIAKILVDSISKDLTSAPEAIRVSFDKVIQSFQDMDNDFFAQRADDYKDVAGQLMTNVLGEKEKSTLHYQGDEIVFLREITPGMVTSMAKSGVKAYCTEHGSYTSHSSILSRALGLTVLVSRQEIIRSLKNKEPAILDALNNKIIINPEEQIIEQYQHSIQEFTSRVDRLKAKLAEPTVTLYGVNITVNANLEYPDEFPAVTDNHCNGIGLFRTEFLYLNRSSLPGEEEQAKVYKNLLINMNQKQVIIRTFDLGGDKISYLQNYEHEENPYLGCRGIRFSLEQRVMFKTQLRAILRASAFGKAAIMFPMIICTEDFLAGKEIVQECQAELSRENIEYDKEIPIGAMIETPAAAICSGQLATVCDFLSLGTNDLVQYTLAVDRNNDKIATYYVQHHPAVLTLIRQTIAACKQAGIPVSICGEMASEPMYVPLLIGLGIEQISIQPNRAAEVKAIIRNCDQQLVDIIANFDFNSDLAHIEQLIKQTLKPYYTI